MPSKIIDTPCWNCRKMNTSHVLADVRLTLCPACKAMFPGESGANFLKSNRELGMPHRERLILTDES